MSDFAFLSGSFNGRSPSYDAQRTLNLYAELSESGTSRSPVSLMGTPGLRLWSALTGAGVRGVIKFTEATAIAVIGVNVWKINAAGAGTIIGTVINEGPCVSMASNGSVIMMVSGAFGYFIDPTANTVTQITDGDFYGGTIVQYLDGYFVWNDPGTGQFRITQLFGTDIDGLDFATAEGAPDPVISLIVDHRELWLFGQDSTEVWFNAGGADFPLQRIQGAFLEIGCLAAFSVAKMDNTVFWLATDDRGFGTIQKAAGGYTPQRVSNHAVEFAIASYGDPSDAVAYTYSQEGHSFYMISFPSAGATWCFDVSTGLWHERPYYDAGTLTRHRSNCQMNFAGETIVGDWENGNLYVLDLDTYTDNGAPIYASRRCPHIASGGAFQFFHALELFMQTGVGLSTGQGSDPQAMLRWSDDGAYSWSSERWASIGRIGKRRSRVRWTRLGSARDRIFEVVITDPIKRVFTGASLS